MAVGDPKPTGTLSPWEALSQKYPDHPHLTLDPLYALPRPLIDSLAGQPFKLNGKQFRVEFLTKAEARFETDLAHHAISGFCNHEPFQYSLLAGEVDPQGTVAKADEAIHSMLMGELTTNLNPKQAEQHLGKQDERNQEIDEHNISYAGWLVSNPTFRSELAALRSSHGARVLQDGFPRLPQAVLFERPDWSGGLGDDPILVFYRRWGLHSLVAWDLPLPMFPAVDRGSLLYDDDTMEQSGLLLFISWHLLRNTDITLQDLTGHRMAERDLKHLADWPVKTGVARPKGPKQHGHLLTLYCYRELALTSRYAGRFQRNVKNLNRVFGNLLGIGEDMVKKLRRDLPGGPASSPLP